MAEAAEAEAEAAPSDSDEEDEFVYNPLKLPLGYDGKPIPFWLYKLHGLNQVRCPCAWCMRLCCQPASLCGSVESAALCTGPASFTCPPVFTPCLLGSSRLSASSQ